MRIPLEQELIDICIEIWRLDRTAEEWAELESSGMFQGGGFSGGFDADERAFCFSYFGNEQEFWFQVSLDEVRLVASGNPLTIEGQLVDSQT